MKKVIVFLVVTLAGFSLQAQNATEIVREAYEKVNGTSSYVEMRMEIVRPEWTRNISIKSWAMGMNYSMVYITAPAQEKGQVFMKRDNEMWNWQPKINRMIKLPPSMMMQSWMGSDFTNDDLINQASIVNDYTHEILSSETYEGYDCWKIEFNPKPDAPVVWGEIVALISKDGKHMFKTQFFDEDDYLVKTEIATDVKTMDGQEITTRFETIPEDKEGHKTIMIMLEVDFKYDLTENFFSQMNMKRIR
ncbi:MAG: outer membrane lipoprotein-sorting protein [Bacteroidota bacterium]|nr:outer membrane lipoprotein-sorting protein [Bacteroidota bacterium]